MHRLTRRTAAVFLLTLLLALPALARPAAQAEPWPGASLFTALWERVASLLEALDGVSSKSRGGFDPDGAAVTATPPEDGESRGSFDPNG